MAVAGNFHQTSFSAIFIFALFAIYFYHNVEYDHVNPEKFAKVVSWLTDDENHHRILKGLSTSTPSSRRIRTLVLIFINVAVWYCWFIVLYTWWHDMGGEDKPLTGLWLAILGDDEDIKDRTSMLMILTLMLFFYNAFEWLHWRETQCVMKLVNGKQGLRRWNLRMDGVPYWYRWFGLPSMWFSDPEACAELRIWMSRAKGNDNKFVSKLYPEEMALYAMDEANAHSLSECLLHAKLFCAREKSYMKINKQKTWRVEETEMGDSVPELDIELLFFDSATGAYQRVCEFSQDSLLTAVAEQSVNLNLVASPSVQLWGNKGVTRFFI